MKQKMSIAGILLLAALGMQANNYTVKSPDGKLVVNVACEGGKASYTVDYNGKQMLGTSALGLVANYGDFSKDLTMGILKGGEVKPLAYKMTRIKKSDIRKDVVDATIGFLNSKKDSMTLHLHVSNNDIAYKYEMSRPKKDNPKSVIIYNEVSGFNFPEKTTTFLCPQITPMTGWERTKPSYEEEYTPDAPMNVKSKFGVGYTFPCLFKVVNDGWVLVSETGVSSAYPGCRLSDYEPGKGYTIAFPQKGENNGIGSEYAGIPVPGETPWRTITVGSSLAPIVETTIPYDVVEPLYVASQTYKPSRYTWSWLFARIYDLYKGDHDAIAAYISGATYKDDQIADTMKKCYNETKYVLDPHGACGYQALKEQLKPGEVGVFLETAHPAKFKEKVDSILGTDIEIPARLAEFMKGEKKSIQMTKDFASFKNYLMNE